METNTQKKTQKYKYMEGWGNHFTTEALEGALPKGQNSPQQCPYGLYAEQLSGTAFTVPRVNNQRTWFYRIQPSVHHKPYKQVPHEYLTNDFSKCEANPAQFRWKPHDIPSAKDQPLDFVQGLRTVAGAGDPSMKSGMAVHLYLANTPMKNKSFFNSDGDFLIVPQLGTLEIQTEMGMMEVAPGEICVIQRGIHFSVKFHEEKVRGYILEVYNNHFRIPDLGPIGANGLANPRDFLTPVAAFEDLKENFTVYQKFVGSLWSFEMDHSPFNVVAWHGNYAPYKYDLSLFNTVNTVSYDHLDPSIYTVLTCPSSDVGTAVADFVIFPPRWTVAEHTFRPPWYHKNCMSEYMGLIRGVYEAKQEGFLPGGGSLHSCMSAHGPDNTTFEKASTEELKPVKIPDTTLAFMFESTYLLKVTDYFTKNLVDHDYYKCWQDLKSHFNPNKK